MSGVHVNEASEIVWTCTEGVSGENVWTSPDGDSFRCIYPAPHVTLDARDYEPGATITIAWTVVGVRTDGVA